jgi:tryptophan 7-halogenase
MPSQTSSSKELKIRNLVIVGGGTAGWMTAAALSKVYNNLDSITLIESDEIGIVGVGEATIPSISIYNNLLQIDERDFLRQTKGTIKMGIEFVGWRELNNRYMHAFGYVGRDLGTAPFHNYWVKQSQKSEALDYWAYSLNNEAAITNRFATADRIAKTPINDLPYAFHFDAGLYARFLRGYSERLGVKRIEGRIKEVKLDPENGYISSLCLDNDQEISGDLYIDASGFHALLIEKALKVDYVDYNDWLPCDRAMAIPCESVPAITPYTRASAHKGGWQWRIPLTHRTGNGVVYSSHYMSDDQALDHLLSNLDGKPLADPRPIRFRTGRREAFFAKNCIAIGLSSGFLEPLESTSIHLIQSGIARLIALFPDLNFEPSLVKVFNKQSTDEFDTIRDFIILHYHANGRKGEALWDHARHMNLPDRLHEKIELFKMTGHFTDEPADLFKLASWAQVMIGQNIIPKSYHPFVDMVGEDDIRDYLKNIRFIVEDTVRQMPPYSQYLRGL